MKKWLILAIIIGIIVIFSFYVFWPEKQTDNINQIQQSGMKNNSEQNSKFKDNINPESRGCQGEGIVNLTSPPRPINQIGFIEPMGLMIGNHVTPVDHQYYSPLNFKPSQELSVNDLKDVLAPADGIITSIGRMPDFFSVKNSEFKDYRLIIYYTCDLYSIFIHIYQLSPDIENELKDLTPGNTKYVNIPIKSGQLIGKANVLDFSLHNNNIILQGFVTPENYNREPWKIHTVDPFDYFIEPVRSQLLEKNIRNQEPYGGKIDYDIDGKLIGNWFKENTNGYQGTKKPEYWTTHVSFSPDALDQEYFLVSLGDFKGEAKQFGTKENSPNPKDVDINSGLIEYELVDYTYIDDKNNYWDRKSLIQGIKATSGNSGVKGVVLVQLIENRKLKLEIFPDKTASEISGFTTNVMMYER